MPAKVILKVTAGALTGQCFVFDEHTTCILGRAEDCEPRVPNDKAHETISRHHCLLDINPPDLRVRDFGSLNGTAVNGTIIGKRAKGLTPEQVDHATFTEYDLKEGDEIRLGQTVFRVSIVVPVCCSECGVELPEDQQALARQPPGAPRCASCRQKAELAHQQTAPRLKPGVCAHCGRDISSELGGHRQGAFLCTTCRANPERLVQGLLALAKQGDPDLAVLAGYRYVRMLGRGGMGAVALVEHEQRGEQVALKLMLPQIAADARSSALFLREVEITKALHHPNVVQLHAFGKAHGVFFFTMEYCAGGSVHDLVKAQGGTLPAKEAVDLMLQALDGLAYAHTALVPLRKADGTVELVPGVVHRDVKPANLLLTEAGDGRRVKVGDYGLARAFEKAGLSGLTRTGTMAGTPRFMPRQQVLNFRYVKPEVDVWALAASLYYLLTGASPRRFPRGTDPWLAVLTKEAVPILPRLLELGKAAIPKPLAEVIDQALRDQPEIGFKTAAEFKQALEGVRWCLP